MERIAMPLDELLNGLLVAFSGVGEQFARLILVGPHNKTTVENKNRSLARSG
jgi:hypothetical protein